MVNLQLRRISQDLEPEHGREDRGAISAINEHFNMVFGGLNNAASGSHNYKCSNNFL